MLFWSCYDSKKVNGMGHFARIICRIQEAGKNHRCASLTVSRTLLAYDWKF
jgi:hypothetical protein